MAAQTQGKEFTIEVDGVSVHVTHKRVKRFNLRIGPDGTAQMSVPLGTPTEQVLAVAKENAAWFKEHVGEVSPRQRLNDLMRYTVNVGDIEVHVTHKRVKNFNMRISREGEAELSAPLSATRARVEEVAHDHEQWFRDALENWRSRQRQDEPHAWETGEHTFVWGREVTLLVHESEGRSYCLLEGDTLEIFVPKGTSATGRELCVERFLEAELKTYVNEILSDCAKRVGAMPKSVTLRRMKSRWGSCTKARGTIRLNVALAEFVPECCECVLCHELCHLIEANHGPRFYELLDNAFPMWPLYQGYLDRNSPRG